MLAPRIIEGVAYVRFRATWRESGRRRQLTVWSPGSTWIHSEVSAALLARNARPDGAVRVCEVA